MGFVLSELAWLYIISQGDVAEDVQQPLIRAAAAL